MRKTLVQIALLLIVLAGGYLAVFQRDKVMELFGKAKKQIAGYKEARNPDEAMEYLNKALDGRNYEAAADYLEGDYAVQLRKIAARAEELARAIDDFKHAMKEHNLKSDTATELLAGIEPFPRRLKVAGEIRKSEDSAVIPVKAESGVTDSVAGVFNVTAKHVKDGGKEEWRVIVPLTARDRVRFERVEKFGHHFVKALNKVKDRLKTDSTTKSDLARDLEEELKEAEKAA